MVRWNWIAMAVVAGAATLLAGDGGARAAADPAEPAPAPAAQPRRPNILVVFGDDIGWFNPSAYNRGMMGYRTPNIDRIASEGILFTDYYGQQSCTAGRAAFITGQTPLRTGLTKVGAPGSKLGLDARDPTIADLLHPLGYATGQFGKNHLGDRDEYLPTVHGFDEFYGNLYHLNAEEEPENPDYPKDPAFRKRLGPRGVLHSYADGKGGQTVEDTGPLTKKRMETIDGEFVAATKDFIKRAHEADKPFFVWFNSTRMHIWTHLAEESKGKTGLGITADGMVEHDGHVGELLRQLDDLGIADDTLVVYSTDNGAESMTWPDGGTTPFRGEKNTNWEGAYRVPCMVRWPGVIEKKVISTDIVSAEDWLPTFVAAAGVPNVKEKLVEGYRAGDKTFKVHLDGYDQSALLTGHGPSQRKSFMYINDEGQLVALRYDRWKMVFAEQRAEGLGVWQENFVSLRFPKLFDLRADPFERADQGSMLYDKWRVEHAFLVAPALGYAQAFLKSFVDFPPRAKPETWNLEQIVDRLEKPTRD